jgi:tRNA (cmo5U34)-methyltransferase
MRTSAPGRRDALFAEPLEAALPFRFDEKVAAVFEDMIGRSVPGYALTLQALAVAARRFARTGTRCYDLGCSLAASTLAMRHHVPEGTRLVGIDNSPAMITRAQELVARDSASAPVELLCADLRSVELLPCSLVAMNFTLQFLPPDDRGVLLTRIARALVPGGALVLSEKLRFEDATEDALLVDLHHEFKALQGYSALEIAQKRNALENVLVPETLAAHRERLLQAGFQRVVVWLQCLNFVSLLAIR